MSLRDSEHNWEPKNWQGWILLVFLLIALLSGCRERSQTEGAGKTPDIPDSSPTTPISPLPTPTTAAVFSSPLATPRPEISLPGRFVFHSDASGTFQIYSMEGNGKNRQQLTFVGGRNIEPAWSPDGKLIAFASDRDDAAGLNIYVMNADGSEQRPLTELPGFALSPSWSPDGKRLVFHTNWEGRFQLYTIELEGGEPQKLLDIPANAYMPDWSPDGSRIVFVGDRDGGNDDIYIVNLDNGEITRLTDHLGRDIRPRWSPDGTQLAYQHHQGEDVDIIVQTLETDETLNVLDDDYRDVTPAWAAEGEYLAVSGTIAESPWALYIIDFEGNRYLLPTTDGDTRYPQWTK